MISFPPLYSISMFPCSDLERSIMPWIRLCSSRPHIYCYSVLGHPPQPGCCSLPSHTHTLSWKLQSHWTPTPTSISPSSEGTSNCIVLIKSGLRVPFTDHGWSISGQHLCHFSDVFALHLIKGLLFCISSIGVITFGNFSVHFQHCNRSLMFPYCKSKWITQTWTN